MNQSAESSTETFAYRDLVDLLQRKSFPQPHRKIYTFLDDGETQESYLTQDALDCRARAIGATLERLRATGQRALLLYPPGLEYIAGFFGCLYAGAVAVPAYPPDPARLNRTLPRLQAMIADAQASFILTTTEILSFAEFLFDQAPDLAALQWIATDTIPDSAAGDWRDPGISRDTLAFLQYTSGSTRTPRGVMLTHGNLLHNSALISQAFRVTPHSVGMVWLPPYHDMGLIGGILQPLFADVPCVLMSPVSFLQRPFRWLQAISRYHATISGGPNFAYDLCVRKTTPEQRATLDLSSWSLAFNGAEPIRPETLDRFAETFAPCGFRREAFYPCYGLAEATLIATGSLKREPPVLFTIQKSALEHNQVIPSRRDDPDAQTLVGCGQALQEIALVDPGSLTRCAPDHVGEIWIAGPSVAQGYWNQPAETHTVFHARLADDDSDFMRTGDLGFVHDGELFVTGRIKDLVIIRGRNHYPQDIELTVESCHTALRPGCGAAFSIDVNGAEELVIMNEVDTRQEFDADAIVNAIRQAVAEAHDVQVYAVVLIEPRSIPKTSSGKIQRHACRAEYLAGTLEIVKVSVMEIASIAKDQAATSEPLLVKALRAMSPQHRHVLLESHIQEQVARVLRVAPSRLNPEQPLTVLGIDSVMAVDLVSELESSLGVTLPIEYLTRGITASQLALLIADQFTARLTPPALVEEPLAEYPLSHGQRALWFLHQLNPDSGAYNLVNIVRITAPMDVKAMQRAFEKIVERHPTLRTTFAAPDGNPIQRVHARIPRFFFSENAATWSQAQLDARLAEEVYRPFDLEQGPLIRVNVFTRSPHEYVLSLAMHHIVTDLWSIAVIMYELGVLYPAEMTGVPAVLKMPRTQYADFIREQDAMLASPEGARHWEYWSQQLAGDLVPLDLPTDRPRPPAQSYHGSSQTIRLGADLARRLDAIAKTHGAPLHALLLAAFETLLYRYTGQDDFLVGSPKAGRTQKWARVIGYFVNPIVLRANLAGNPSFVELLARARQTVEDAFAHDAFPISLLVERLQPTRDLSRSPLFQVMFAWQKTTRLVEGQSLTSLALAEPGKNFMLDGMTLQVYPMQERVVPFDLLLQMAEADNDLVALMEYNADLFDGATIARMLGHFQNLLEGISANPNLPIADYQFLSLAEQQHFVEWNAHETREPSAPCMHRLIEAQVERTPESIAVALGDAQLTYRELNARANRLARHLQTLGVGPEVIVALSVERSLDMIVGLLGILKAGGAYLPLDPAYPRERIAFMLNDSQARIRLTQQSLLNRLPHHHTPTLCLDSDWDAIAKWDDANLPDSAALDHLAYVLYTSGSTGEPKGVMITHDAIANHCRDCQRYYEITAQDRALQFASLNFDASLEQIFTALIAGAQLVLRGPEILDARRFNEMVAANALTIVNVPPAYWHQWAQACADATDLSPNHQVRLVIIGGDVVLPEMLALWRRTPMRGARLLNAYGPTETTITALTFEVEDQITHDPRVPVGRPLANRAAYILDRMGNPVPVGVPGELHIGGASLARGYLNRPELTAEKFINYQLPIANCQLPIRVYKTGDLARFRSDGNIEFLGRLDNQIKIRGIRVELGEIEAALNQHPIVREGIVIAREDSAGEKQLVAYVVAREDGQRPTANELRDFLRAKLPDYMAPAAFIFLDALPLNVSGKVDRRALPIPDLGRPDLASSYVAPRTTIEAELARVWAALLKVERVGIHDNFFDLGGHSLLATQLASRIRDTFQVELPLRRFFESATIADLSVLISYQVAQSNSAEIDQLLGEIEALSDEQVQASLNSETR
ncbi:MAG: amino acid adenylation domain-containing protein [Chloroflexi bacterium]|nr:amino acid adenylation domain-containing protein [Chloroflexota bacterium]